MRKWSYGIKLTPEQYSFGNRTDWVDSKMTSDEISAIADAEDALFGSYRVEEELNRLAEIDSQVGAGSCTEAIEMLDNIFKKRT